MSKHIPNEIITTNILPRLPAKTVGQFKCVNKLWKSEIEHPIFIQCHNDFSVDIESNLSLILTCGSTLTIIHNLLEDTENHHAMPVPLPPSFVGDTGMKIVGSYNGLVCIGSGKTLNNYFVFNPNVPRNPKILPFALNFFSRTFGGESLEYLNRRCLMTSGFGYDHISEAYKLVYVFILTGKDPQPEGMVYNSKTGSWTMLEMPVYVVPPESVDKWVFCGELNNSLLFVGQRDTNVIMTFDLYDEKWGKITLPCCQLGFEVDNEVYELEQRYKVKESYDIIDACVLRGCLCALITDHGCRHPSFWVWKQYGVKESWAKLFTVTIKGRLRVLYYLTDKPLVLLVHETYGVVWYDHQEGTIIKQITKGSAISDCRVVSAGSLISPPCKESRKIESIGEENELTRGGEGGSEENSIPLRTKQLKAEKRRLKILAKTNKNKEKPEPTIGDEGGSDENAIPLSWEEMRVEKRRLKKLGKTNKNKEKEEVAKGDEGGSDEKAIPLSSKERKAEKRMLKNLEKMNKNKRTPCVVVKSETVK